MLFPELKQLWELALNDFKRHPVWVGVYNFDINETWYHQCDEATYRPWLGALPIDAGVTSVLVLAVLETSDSGLFEGFVRAAQPDWDTPPSPHTVLGLQQPVMYLGNVQYTFWKGRRGLPVEAKQAFYQAIGKGPAEVFPLQFTAYPNLATGITSGRINGFYRALPNKPPSIER